MSGVCELCASPGGTVLWHDDSCRVVRVGDPDYPGFCRVIWNAHVGEMSDLDARQRQHLMDVVFAVEQTMRACLVPDKINLASLGNMTPHLHWHVIPRFRDDRHFPLSVWSQEMRAGKPHARSDLDEAIKARLTSESWTHC